MRQTHLHACWTIVFLSACAGQSDPAAGARSGLRAAEPVVPEVCGDAEPEEPSVEDPSAEEPSAEEAAAACLFGDVFSDIRTNEALSITDESWLEAADELTDLEAAQLVLAVQQSSHTDVSTAAEALERVDQQQVRRVDFYELASERWFVAYEYGVGDNSYGAFFDQEGTDVLASIHDGDLLSCSVTPTPAEDAEE